MQQSLTAEGRDNFHHISTLSYACLHIDQVKCLHCSALGNSPRSAACLGNWGSQRMPSNETMNEATGALMIDFQEPPTLWFRMLHDMDGAEAAGCFC